MLLHGNRRAGNLCDYNSDVFEQRLMANRHHPGWLFWAIGMAVLGHSF